jgi:hypothetical protein
MPYYNLEIKHDNKILSTPALDREHALEIFGKELGVKLTFENKKQLAQLYLLDEWEVGPHWINPHIPVFQDN